MAIRDEYNVIPVMLAALFHAAVFAALVVGIDLTRPTRPAVPLAITATIVSEDDIRQPEPEPEPVVEPEPEPDPAIAEQERLRLEEEKRLADLKAEQERIRIQEEEARQRREREAAERKRREEAELERRRQEAERKRQEDLERQRQENERLRREAEEAELQRRRQQEIEAEERRLAAMQADDVTRWIMSLQQQIGRNFVPPASTPEDFSCVVEVRQLPGGTVVDVSIGQCNGDETVKQALEAAVFKASPLLPPDNPAIFERDLRITFRHEQ